MKDLLTILITILTMSQPVFAQIEATSEEYNFTIRSRDRSAPVLDWLAPAEDLSLTSQHNFNLRMGIRCPSDIESIKIVVNGMDLDNTRGLGVKERRTTGEYDELIDTQVNLVDGDNLLMVTVTNRYGVATTESKTIRFSSSINSRSDRAIIFATNNYDEWENLTNPIFDATTIAEELREVYGFEVELMTDNSIEDILLKLKEYATRSYLPNDQLFVFFAGHGHYDELLGDGYIVGTESRVDDASNRSYLSYSVLARALNNIPSNHIFLTLDVCFGGTFDSKLASGDRGGGDIYSEVSREEFIERRLKYKTRKFLTSGGVQYVPDGRPGEHSPFTKMFIESLRTNGGKDSILTLNDILESVSRVNPQPHFGEFGSNEAGSDFVFVAR
jgi:hypothetical protein